MRTTADPNGEVIVMEKGREPIRKGPVLLLEAAQGSEQRKQGQGSCWEDSRDILHTGRAHCG